jgi:Protocatechuate 3,4-dioxygenase beta subunit
MRNLDENTITEAVLARHAHSGDERLKTIVTSLVRHLHDFAREVNLTESEWEQGIRFLTDVGHITDDKRQEFILLSDTLGLSMLVTAMANRKPPGCTEATVFGPFFVEGAPAYRNGDDVSNGARGEPCFVSGTVKGADGEAWPMRASRSGKPTRTASTMCNTPVTTRIAREACSIVSPTDAITSVPSSPSLIRFHTMDRSGVCSRRSAGIRGVRRICIS